MGPAKCPNYPTWSITTNLKPGTKIEFKAIKKDESGNVIWESGNNRIYTVPENGQGQVTFNW